MDQAISKIEPLAVPTERHPIPSLPAWVISIDGVLAKNVQIDRTTGKWGEPYTLPAAMMLTADQRTALQNHLDRLRCLLAATADADDHTRAALLAAVTKLMLAKPARAGGPEAAEARGEAYEAALEDVPLFAVIAAIRKWYRGESGGDNRGAPYEYQWAPDSAVLRRLAMREVWVLRGRAKMLEDILSAVQFVDCAKELEEGQAAILGLWRAIARKWNIRDLTLADAVALGHDQEIAPPVQAAAEWAIGPESRCEP